MSEIGVVILGGGPCGLGAARALEFAGFPDWALFETQDVLGGLSRSFVDARGFTWDVGGHVVFSHYNVFDELLDSLFPSDGWLYHDRESWIRVLDSWVPYPFQNNLHRLPKEEQARCLTGLVEAALQPHSIPPADFDQYIVATMGEGIANVFMRPYNSKVWACPPREMTWTWIGERVALPDPVRATRNTILGRDDVAWGPNARFRFPLTGGTGAIWQAVADSLPAARVHSGMTARRINVSDRMVEFHDGTTQSYTHLISTLPLDVLTGLTGRDEWIRLAQGLRHSAVHVVGVGIKGSTSSDVSGKCWMYFPEARVPFYRVTNFSHYSPSNVDDIRVHWSLMAEVSESPGSPRDPDVVVQETVQGLAREGLIEGALDVSHTWHHRAEYGYPTPTPGRDAILETLLPALDEQGIVSRGRFGAWRYEVGNMDHSFMQGFEAARRILGGAQETTVWNPELVNRPRTARE